MAGKKLILRTFKYDEATQFRVIDRKGGAWFILNEVCDALELVNASQVASRLDDDEKSTIIINEVHGGNIVSKRSSVQHTIIISESGLYSLIMTSRKPEAKAFKKWVTSEVLPSIRKTGTYKYNGKDNDWIEIREEGIDTRNGFTAILEPRVDKWGIKNCTDAVYKEVLGSIAVVYRKLKGLPRKANLRESATKMELLKFRLVEELSGENVIADNAYGKACQDICNDTARNVVTAIEDIRNKRKKVA